MPERSSAVDVSSEQKPKLQRRVFPVPRVFTWVAITVIACSLLGGLEYFRRRGTQSHAGDKTSQAQQESSKTNSDVPNPHDSLGKQTVSGKVAESADTAGDRATGGIAIGTLEFNWPGDDSWDVYRAEQLVASHWGSAKQALEAGTYSIKPKNNPVFKPFDISIKSGSSTKVQLGGNLEFNWAGDDSWDVYQAEQLVASHWGSAKQALEAGTYTIKPKNNPVFKPFDVQITDGGKTKVP